MLLLTYRIVQERMLVQIHMIGEVFYCYIVGRVPFQIPCMENLLMIKNITSLLHNYQLSFCEDLLIEKEILR